MTAEIHTLQEPDASDREYHMLEYPIRLEDLMKKYLNVLSAKS